jgi:hypothetical protein
VSGKSCPPQPVHCSTSRQHPCTFITVGKDGNITEEEEALLEGTKHSLLAQVLLELAAQSMEHSGVSW